MTRTLKCLCITMALAFAACAHYPDDGGPGGGDDGGACPGMSCPSDGGSGSGSDGGMTDGGSGSGADGGTCGTCPEGKTCKDGQCVCDGDDSDGSCRPGKTLLCHYPPGNPGNRHDICVGDPAVPAHLAHGDTLGACP